MSQLAEGRNSFEQKVIVLGAGLYRFIVPAVISKDLSCDALIQYIALRASSSVSNCLKLSYKKLEANWINLNTRILIRHIKCPKKKVLYLITWSETARNSKITNYLKSMKWNHRNVLMSVSARHIEIRSEASIRCLYKVWWTINKGNRET